MAKILLLIAQQGFQTKEYHDSKRILEGAGHNVVAGSVVRGSALSNIGEESDVDIALSDVHVGDYDAIFVIGGPGALSSLDNPETERIMREAQEREEMLYGAICVSPRILAKAGVLEGKRATGWDGDGKLSSLFARYKVIYDPKHPVVIDGRVVTANGPLSAEEFGYAISSLLEEKRS